MLELIEGKIKINKLLRIFIRKFLTAHAIKNSGFGASWE